MTDINYYLSLIKKHQSITNYEVVSNGFNSYAIIIDKEYVYRFPKDDWADYRKEKEILDVISPNIKSTKIPTLTLYEDNNIIYSKHNLIKGIEYSKYKGSINKKQLAKDLAKFAMELHSIKTNFEIKHFSTTDFMDMINDKEFLDFYLTKDELQDFKKCKEFLDKYSNFRCDDNVICHDDINENNIVILNGKLNGIIDFGNCRCENRSVEFATLLKFDAELTLLWIKEYEKLTNRKIDINYALQIQKFRCYAVLQEFWKDKNNPIINEFKIFLKNLKILKI
jgi:aminoglycoside 2''-phosphotransferase